MKTRIATMMVIAIFAVQFTTAGEPVKKFATIEQKIAFASKNLLVALHSSNTGVLESAMRITAQMKMQYRTADVSQHVGIMNELWRKNPIGTTRYKAYIAASICENPDWYSNESSIATAGDENFFHAASAILREQLLSSK